MFTKETLRESTDPLARDFEDLFREHHGFVFRTAYSVAGNAYDAEDVLQTIFLRILRQWHERPPGLQANPKGYLYRAAVNESLNIIRTRRGEVPALGGTRSAVVPSVEPRWTDEMRTRLSQAMAHLRPRAVEILVLHYEHGYSDAEIARMLGTSRGTVAVSLYRTRARLKKLLLAASGERQ